MRAAILDAPGASLTIYDDVEAEAPHAGEVAVRVSHCGVCHSDLHLIDGGMPPMTPLVLGHEAAGVVEAIGPGVTRLAVGDHVVLTPVPAVRPLLLVPAGRAQHLHQQPGPGHLDAPRRRHPAQPGRPDRLPRPRRGRLRRDGHHPGDRRGQDPRRRAARRGLRDRLRGADRRRRGAPHRRRAVRRHRAGARPGWRGPVGRPGRPARRGHHDHRVRSGGRAARGGRCASAPPTPSIPPPRTSSPAACEITDVGVDFAFDAVGKVGARAGRPGRHPHRAAPR